MFFSLGERRRGLGEECAADERLCADGRCVIDDAACDPGSFHLVRLHSFTGSLQMCELMIFALFRDGPRVPASSLFAAVLAETQQPHVQVST